MKRKIIYIMSLLFVGLSLVLILAHANSSYAAIATIGGVDVEKVVSALAQEANGEELACVGYSTDDAYESISGENYYSLYANSAYIKVPVFVVNQKSSYAYFDYETSDYTAIAGTDYNASSGKLRVSKTYRDETKSGISFSYNYVTIDATIAAFALQNETSIYDTQKINYSNTFLFKITSASTPMSSLKDRVAVHLDGDIDNSVISSADGNPYLGIYSKTGNISIDDVEDCDDDSTKYRDSTYSFTNSSEYTLSMVQPYIKGGYADFYMRFSCNHDLSANVSDTAKAEVTCTTKTNKQIFYAYTTEDDDDDDKITSSSHNSKGVVLNSSGDKYQIIPDNSSLSKGFELKFECNSFWTNTNFDNIRINCALYDSYAPKVTKTFLDTSMVSSTNHKIYYKMRFNEPVRATKDTGFLAYVNNNSSSSGEYLLKFKYYGGSLTNTIIFEADLDEYAGVTNGTTNIQKITPLGFSTSEQTSYIQSLYSFTDNNITYSFNGLTDLSWSHNRVKLDYGILDGASSIACSIDARKPNITISHQNSIKSSHATSFYMTNCSTGTIYYIMDQNDTEPMDWSTATKLTYTANEESVYSKTITTSSLNGIWYIHTKVITDFGQVQTTINYANGQKYRFDNTGPTLTHTANAANTLKSREFTITATDYPSESSIGVKTIFVDVLNADGEAVISLSRNTDSVFTFTIDAQNPDGNNLGLANGEKGTYTIQYYAVDQLENESEKTEFSVQFDTNNYFAGDISIDSTRSKTVVKDQVNKDFIVLANVDPDNTTEEKTVYYSSRFTITFTDPANEGTTYESITELTLVDAEKNSILDDLSALATETVDGVSVGTCSNGNISIKYTNNDPTNQNTRTVLLDFIGHASGVLDYGYYDLRIVTSSARSFVYRLYIGSNNEEPANIASINNAKIVLNNVVKLPTEYSTFYYLDDTDNLLSVKTVKYHATATTVNPIFSNILIAKEFINTMEYKDIKAIKLTAEQASLMTQGTQGYIRANGETATPAEGQIWIRYKISSWTSSSSSATWRWYFYKDSGDAASINPNGFSSNLVNAINQVTDTISDTLYSDYLVEETDDYGNPRLATVAIFPDSITVTSTYLGTSYSAPITYSGDADIYVNYIRVNSMNYKLATNYYLSLNSNSRLFFFVDNVYYLIPQAYDGESVYVALKEVLNLAEDDLSSKLIQLYEFDGAGSATIQVYLDVEAPTITLAITDSNGDVGNKSLSLESKNVTISGKAVQLMNLVDTDAYSYAILRTYIRTSVGNFLKFYRLSEIAQNQPLLDAGNYILTISDRSGNSYSIYIFIDNTELSVSQNVVVNEYFKIDCNRTESQISLFEIYFNDKLINNTYDLTTRYAQSGIYRIYVRDVYGNTYDEYFEFERDYPTVTWSYLNNGVYTSYKTPGEHEISPMNIMATGEGEFTIITNTSLSFVYPTNCGFEFEEEPEDYTIRELTNSVLIGSEGDVSSFVLRVYYNNLKNLYTRYICYVDITAPSIKAMCTYNDFNLDTDNQNILIDDNGNLVAPSSLWFEKVENSTYNYVIATEGVVYTDSIVLNVSDENDICSVTISIDGVVVQEYTDYDDIEFNFSKYGLYYITATDIFGNKSEFTFENKEYYQFNAYVDGESLLVNRDVTEYFNSARLYTKVDYGHTNATVEMVDNGFIRLILTYGAVKDYVIFKYSESTLYQCRYYVEGNELATQIEETYDLEAAPTGTISLSGLQFNYSYEVVPGLIWDERVLTFSFDVMDDTPYGIELRFDSEGISPYYFKAEISTHVTPALFYDLENVIIPTGVDTDIKFSDEFKVVPKDSGAEVIVLFDPAGHFIYDNNIYKEGAYYTDEGAYQITITNKYGNSITYNLIFYKSYLVAVNTTYDDETSFSFTNPEEVYSNYHISVILYDQSTIKVTKDGEKYEVSPEINNDVISFTLGEEGDYHIYLMNEYGNDFEFDAYIKRIQITEPGILNGYNEKALRKSEGYTNLALSINYDVAILYKYISVQYEDNLPVVLLDKISGADISLDAGMIQGYVGSLGDGIYDVLIRDIYGNKFVTKIHYRSETTLDLSRRIRTSTEDEAYAVDFAQEEGFWSNNHLIFATDASVYDFKIDGKSITLPYKLSYNTTEGEGSYTYQVDYVDEYGFSYSFKAHLVRKTIKLEMDEDIKTAEINGVITTRYPFNMVYDNANSCKYVIDSVEYNYSGEAIYADGTYRFVATDLAGNTESLVVVKDSIVEFLFRNAAEEKAVVFGETITQLRMTFTPKNGDSAYISAAYKDGVEISNLDASFNDPGLYEFLISDAIGNETYFKFRIINNVVGSFEYVTPYSYLVTAVDYYTNLMPNISYMEYVDQFEDYSSMKFTEDGFYTITTRSKDTGEIITLSFEINTAPPAATLSGVAEGEATTNTVNLTGLTQGDVVEVYKDGYLLNTYYVSIDGEGITNITEGGSYKIVVTNAAGVSKTLTFTRKHTANAAGSALLVIGSIVIIGVIFFGILQHNKKKTDE